MKIDLAPALVKMVAEKVEAGLYSTPEAVVGDALRLMQARDQAEQLKLDRLREMIAEGRRDFAEGRVHSFEAPADLDAFFATL